ncbi:MAG: DUF4743 domain-containing protein [Burkholderiales bacterium]
MTLADQLARALEFDPARFVPWGAGNETVGWVTPGFAHTLQGFADVFRVRGDGLALIPEGRQQRTAALERVARALAARGVVSGWRDERYAIRSAATGEPLFDLERAAIRRFGLRAHAAHLNGYVRAAGGMRIWIARRSLVKPIDPGQLDNLVGGGIASGMGARATLVKECWEEAGITRETAARAIAAGRLRVRRAVEEGLHDESLIVFDLELPPDFRPCNRDGEVAEFLCLGMPELIERLAGGEFTADAGAVAIDWLARQGSLESDAKLAGLLVRLREDPEAKAADPG